MALHEHICGKRGRQLSLLRRPGKSHQAISEMSLWRKRSFHLARFIVRRLEHLFVLRVMMLTPDLSPDLGPVGGMSGEDCNTGMAGARGA